MIYLYKLDMMSQYNLHEHKISDYNTNSACFYISAKYTNTFIPNSKYIERGYPSMAIATEISCVKQNCIILYKTFKGFYEDELRNNYKIKVMNDVINRYKSISDYDYNRKDK